MLRAQGQWIPSLATILVLKEQVSNRTETDILELTCSGEKQINMWAYADEFRNKGVHTNKQAD